MDRCTAANPQGFMVGINNATHKDLQSWTWLDAAE